MKTFHKICGVTFRRNAKSQSQAKQSARKGDYGGIPRPVGFCLREPRPPEFDRDKICYFRSFV